MLVLLVSDDETLAGQIRPALLAKGMDCPFANVVPLAQAVSRLTELNPGLIVLGMPADRGFTLEILKEMPSRTDVPILAVGPVSDSKTVLHVLRHGANEYLDVSDLRHELEAALQHLASRLNPPKENARLLAVMAASGGSGSSTLAVNIATTLAKEHKKALLIDLNAKTGDLAALLDLRPSHSLADLCRNPAAVDASMLESSLVRHESGVHLLASPRRAASIITRMNGLAAGPGQVTPEGVRQILQVARTMFPYIVADLPQSFAEDQVQYLRQADEILLVFRLDFHALRNTRWTLEQMDLLGIHPDRVRLVVNRFGQAKELPAKKAEEALNRKIFHLIPDDPATINKANNYGLPAVLCAPKAKVSRSLIELAQNVHSHGKI